MADKAKFAYGSLANLDAALQSGAVDAFDLLCLYDDGVARIGWVNKNGKPVLVDVPGDDVLVVDELPETGETGVIYIVGEVVYIWSGTQFIVISESTDLADVKEQLASLEGLVSALEEKSAELETEVAAKIDTEEADAKYLSKKYEITGVPEGTLVNYGEKEIRVMVPADAQWTKQSVGAGGDANTYYLTFKTYVYDNDIVGYIEHLGDQVDSEILTDLKTDEYGRRYQPTWLGLAKYDEASDTWTYYGANSSEDKYIGWDYQIDWYNADGVVIASDRIRINLSNEECHSVIEPYYMADITAEVKKYVDEQIEEVSEIPVVEF